MKFGLFCIGSAECISVVSKNYYYNAYNHFQKLKNLTSEEFDKLFLVRYLYDK